MTFVIDSPAGEFVITMSPTIHFVLGQTATGKTARATQLAKEQNGELINCDSRQVYQHLDIITGKTDNPPDIPMHLVDIVDPHEIFSAYDFAQLAIRAIRDTLKRGRCPIVVGGTGNYARMLLYLNPMIVHVLPLSPQTDNLNKQDLQQKLMKLDIDGYHNLTPSDQENPRRLVRAIQRIESETREILDPDSPYALANKYHIEIVILLHKDQEVLTSRIAQRVDDRLAADAVGECQSLLAKGYVPTDPGLATIGYQSVFRYLTGTIDFETMKTEWATKERQYAKRQKTYLLKYFPGAKVVYV